MPATDLPKPVRLMQVQARARGMAGQATVAFGYKGVSALLNYALLAYAAGSFGLKSAGLLASIVAWTTLISTFSHMGHAVASTRYMAVLRDDRHDLVQYSRQSLRETSIGAGLWTAAIGAVGLALLVTGDANGAAAALLVMVAQPAVTLHRLFEGASRGRERISTGLLPFSVIVPLLAIVGMVLVPSTLRSDWVPAVAYSVACFVTLPLGYLVTWSGISLRRQATGPADRRARIDRRAVALRLMVFSSAGFVMRQADVAILGLFASGDEVGRYALVSRAAWTLSIVLFALNASASPRVARQFAMGNIERVRLIFRKLRMVSALTMCGIGISALALTPIIERVVDVHLSSRMYIALAVLIVGQAASGLAGPVGALLNMVGAESETSRLAIIANTVCVVASVIGAYTAGAIGVAAAASGSLILHNVLLTGVRVRLLKKAEG